MTAPRSPECPSCRRTFAYVGALGCTADSRTCKHSFHCRLPSHRVLAHPMTLLSPDLSVDPGLDRTTD